MSFRLTPKSVTLNDLERHNGVISANSGIFRAHCIKVHVRYLISWWVLVVTVVYGGGGHWLVWMEWRPAGRSVCLPLLIFPCIIKSRSSLLAPAHPGGPGNRAVKRLRWWWLVYRYIKIAKMSTCRKCQMSHLKRTSDKAAHHGLVIRCYANIISFSVRCA